MLIKIAWRNIWRNKIRSLTVIISIALGILAGLVTMALSVGMNNARTRDAINTYISHIQIHTPPYKEEAKLAYAIPDVENVRQKLQQTDSIVSFSMRTLTSGMATSANGVQGVMVTGINPAAEAEVSSINEKIVEGHYFRETRRNPIVVGNKLAEKLKVNLNNKLVLTFQDVNGEIVSSAFRINGIFKTTNSKYDESAIFVDQKDLQKLLGAPFVHEVAIMTSELSVVDIVSQDLKNALPNLTVEKWSEVSPDLGYADEMMSTMMYIFIGIILLAMAFGILNTMLMAVLERKRELGMLMAIGMNKVKIFGMILYETVFLASVAGPTGLILAFWLNDVLGKYGIDLSAYGKGMESFGMSSVVYPELETPFYFSVALMVFVMAILSSIYPAIKAVKLKPSESMRTV